MSKLIIDNIIIEKSDKDIKTGIKYEFSSGINLICGNNEAGKSSLMNFIREGFFRPIKTDTGKIFFSIINNNHEKQIYRADIKNSLKKADRCKLYDENNLSCDYSLIEKIINQKYFEQGFTINLDDLMSLQFDNNLSLVNIIKDPSGDKLNSILQKVENNISEYIGINGKPKKVISELLEEISNINKKINELSQKENQYNNIILTIHNYEEEIINLSQKEEYLNILINLKSTNAELQRLNEVHKHLNIDFNINLYNNKEKYIDIVQNVGKYKSNFSILEKNKQKLENIITKINSNLNHLNYEYNLNTTEEELNNFIIDYDKISKIKEIIPEIENNKTEIKTYKRTIEDIEENLLKLQTELEYLQKGNIEKYNIQELKDFYSIINDGLKQYKYLSNEISNIDKNIKINSSGIWTNRNSLILFASLFLLMASCSIVSFYLKETTAGIFSLLMSILIGIGFAIQKLSSYQDNQASDKIRKETQQEAILCNIIEKIKFYYPEINNVESSYLTEKLEDLKQEINIKILNHNSFQEKVRKNESDRKFNENKLLNIKEKISNLENKNIELIDKIQNLIGENKLKLNEQKYIDVIEIIKDIKEFITEKNMLISEITDIEVENNKIIKEFNSFIIENKININFSSNIKNNLEELQELFEKNNELKKQIAILDVSIENLNTSRISLEEQKIPFTNLFKDIDESTNINIVLEETKIKKQEKQNLKKDAEFEKRGLEDFEGISDLKNKRNILINEYRNIVKKILVNKAISEITTIAKNNFDKTQPDLINAQKYLSILTDNKYSRINLEAEEISNFEGNIIKKWNELSRGTKEQLYLALRLGYASNYSKDKTTLQDNGRADLPIIIDDAFVNFDYGRTHNALKCLIDFSKTNQVLFFTCHTDLIKQHFEQLNLQEDEFFKIIYIK